MAGFDRIQRDTSRQRGDALRRLGQSPVDGPDSGPTAPSAQRDYPLTDPFARIKPPRARGGRPNIFERQGLDVVPEADILDPTVTTSTGGIDTREIYAELGTGQAQRRVFDNDRTLKWVEIDSSRVARAAYDPDGGGELLVDFVDGTPWSYFGVAPEVAQQFFTADSPGRFINEYFTPVKGPAKVAHGYRA